MKKSLKLAFASLVLLTQTFGQEPKKALAAQEAKTQSTTQTLANGSARPLAPVTEPKALPPMNPPLGDVARQARAARATAAKARMTVEDTAEQK